MHVESKTESTFNPGIYIWCKNLFARNVKCYILLCPEEHFGINLRSYRTIVNGKKIDSENLAKAYRKLKFGEDVLKRYFILPTKMKIKRKCE